MLDYLNEGLYILEGFIKDKVETEDCALDIFTRAYIGGLIDTLIAKKIIIQEEFEKGYEENLKIFCKELQKPDKNSSWLYNGN